MNFISLQSLKKYAMNRKKNLPFSPISLFHTVTHAKIHAHIHRKAIKRAGVWPFVWGSGVVEMI